MTKTAYLTAYQGNVQGLHHAAAGGGGGGDIVGMVNQVAEEMRKRVQRLAYLGMYRIALRYSDVSIVERASSDHLTGA